VLVTHLLIKYILLTIKKVYFMKKVFYFVSVLTLCVMVGILTTSFSKDIKNPEGCVGGYTGSVASGGPIASGTCSSCHDGATGPDNSLIILNVTTIPDAGWVAGETYEITIHVPVSDGTMPCGFEISSENGAGVYLGTLSIKDAVNTKFTNLKPKNITQTAAGSSAPGAGVYYKEWTVNWTAPAHGAGGVTINVCASVDGFAGQVLWDDRVYLEATSGINELSKENVTLCPNPVSNILNVNCANTVDSYTVYSITGQVIESSNVNANEFNVNVNTLKTGVYTIKLNSKNGVVTKNFVVE